MAESLDIKNDIAKILDNIIDPNTKKKLSYKKNIREIILKDEHNLEINISLPYTAKSDHQKLIALINKELISSGIYHKTKIHLFPKILSHKIKTGITLHDNISNIILVGSSKGGVGKSTVAANIAAGLKLEGANVGILDADIHGPSIGLIYDVEDIKPQACENPEYIHPVSSNGIELMSMGFLLKPRQSAIWRGPILTKVLNQLLHKTKWSKLDYLIIDLPPGTGDIQLTIAQKFPVVCSILVSTAQKIATEDSSRAVHMFEKLSIPLLGVVFNMFGHSCENCGFHSHVFGETGALESIFPGLDILAKLPIASSINLYKNKPITLADPNNSISIKFIELAKLISYKISSMPYCIGGHIPKVVTIN